MRHSNCIIFCFILISLFLVFVQRNVRANDTVEEPPYGHWWLLNPGELKQNLISGVLSVCKKEEKEVCGEEEVTLVLLEKNTGHGCTDYVGKGVVIQNASDRIWKLFLSNNGELKVWATASRTGSRLRLKLEDNESNLNFELSTPDNIDEKAKIACEKSYMAK